MSALFAEIQGNGDGITSRLRHVTDDQKLYKQKREVQAVSFDELEAKKAAAEERRAAKERAALESAAAEAAAAAKSPSAALAAAPQFALEGGKRWAIKNQIGTPSQKITLVIDEPSMQHAVQIQHCEHVFIEIRKKINSISFTDCKKVQVSLVSVVSTVDITNSNSVDVQVSAALPSVQLENSHCINLFLLNPEEARKTEVVTVACSSVNVNFPDETDPDDLVERALPEQYVSKLVPNGKGGFKIETKCSEIC